MNSYYMSIFCEDDDTTRRPGYRYTLVESEMLITAFGVSLKIPRPPALPTSNSQSVKNLSITCAITNVSCTRPQWWKYIQLSQAWRSLHWGQTSNSPSTTKFANPLEVLVLRYFAWQKMARETLIYRDFSLVSTDPRLVVFRPLPISHFLDIFDYDLLTTIDESVG